jgi:hypothetical protein
VSGSTPIVFIHKGYSWHLPYVLRQAAWVNSNCGVVLIFEGQDIAVDRGINKKVGCVPVDRILSIAPNPDLDRFCSHYRHMSSNSTEFELFCWKRWYYLLSYMEAEHIDRVLYLDSDVLVYYSTDYLLNHYSSVLKACALMIPQQDHQSFSWCVSGHISYWTKAALKEFCSFILDSFESAEKYSHYCRKWEWHNECGSPGGICDMTTLYLFWRSNQASITNFAEEYVGGVFDMNFSLSLNYRENEYVLKNGHKAVEFVDGKPVFFRDKDGRVNAHAIHFQGHAKNLIPSYYNGPLFRQYVIRKAEKRLKDLLHGSIKSRLKNWLRRAADDMPLHR